MPHSCTDSSPNGVTVADCKVDCVLLRMKSTRKRKATPHTLVIAFASDFHAGPITHPEMFTTLVAELMVEGPMSSCWAETTYR